MQRPPDIGRPPNVIFRLIRLSGGLKLGSIAAVTPLLAAHGFTGALPGLHGTWA
jgi:hypothetical protein